MKIVSAIENLQSKYKMGDNKRLLHIEKIHAENKEVCFNLFLSALPFQSSTTLPVEG